MRIVERNEMIMIPTWRALWIRPARRSIETWSRPRPIALQMLTMQCLQDGSSSSHCSHNRTSVPFLCQRDPYIGISDLQPYHYIHYLTPWFSQIRMHPPLQSHTKDVM